MERVGIGPGTNPAPRADGSASITMARRPWFEERGMAMTMRRVSPHVKEAAPGTWSNCRVYGDQVFIAGMTAHDFAGGTMNDTIRLDICVTDILQREGVWRARDLAAKGGTR